MSVKEELIEHLEMVGDSMQTLAAELEDDNIDPHMIVSMQIHGERDYQKTERLLDTYLKELDEEGS